MKRVFVVEDEAVVAMELKDHLRAMGYEVCGHAARGEVALREILEARPDLVLMDINLGEGMSGLDVAERLRSVVDIPLLFITAYSDAAIAERVGRSGSFAYLVKPFEPRVLAANIELALARHDATIALRASEERFRALFEHAPVGILIADGDRRCTALNDVGCRILGYARDELVGERIMDLVGEQDARGFAGLDGPLVAGETRVREWLVRRKDGAWIPVEMSANILADGRWQGFFRDIRERRRAQAQLHQSQERFELALKGADLGAWDWNIRSGEVIFNARWAEMRGFTLAELKPHVDTWSSGVHPDDWPHVVRALTDYQEGKIPTYEVEHRAATKSGEWIWILDRGKVFERDEQGQPTRMVGTELDITARKRTEEALRTSEARYRAMVAAIPDPLLRIDRDLRCLDVAASDPSQLALPPEALRGKTIAEAFGPLLAGVGGELADAAGLVQQSTEAIRRALDTGALQRFECAFRQRWFEARVIRSGPGEVLEILRDISDRKGGEDLLRAAVESRESLLAAVAHDLRSPLCSIRLSAQLLAKAPLGDELGRGRRPLEVILSSVDRMSRLIDDLLQAATIEAGKFTVEPTREEALPLLEEVLQALEPAATARAVHLQRAVPEVLPAIRCDRLRVIQVLSNLIGNALKFVREGGTIEVRAAVRGGELCFAVRDDGPGIGAEQMQHLFERYWKGPTEGHRGIGLGLFLSKGIVEAHGGRIWVESQVGVGSTFYFTIPIA